jgi:hypothetical protein
MTWTHSPGGPVGEPFDIAVSMTSMLRPTLLAAVRSVFAQDFRGRVQVLIGIDRVVGSRDVLDAIRAECPSNMAITVCDPGYSTAKRNGGVASSPNGGSMPAVLSWLAHARYLAYLDDDNWWAPDHLSSLHMTIRTGVGWAYSDRWLVRASDDQPLAIDRWMSAGAGRGLFKDRIGGMVDTNCLLIDRERAGDVLWRWSHSFHPKRGDHDRQIFKALLRKEPSAATGRATVYYRISEQREATVRGMMSLPPEPPARSKRISLSVLRPWLQNSDEGAETRRPTAVSPPPEDDPLRRWIQHVRPMSMVTLWPGDGAWPLRLAAVNRACELKATILAIDTWLPAPGSNTARGRYSMARYGTPFEAFQKAVRAAGEQDVICPLAACPRHAASVLEAVGLRVDMISMPAFLPELEATLRAWWPLLQIGGAAMLHASSASGDPSGLRTFMAARGVTLRRVRDGNGMLIAVYKIGGTAAAAEAAA